MKTPSPAQLAARAKFAAAAKAGKFKRKASAAKSSARKRNPVGPKHGSGSEYFAHVKGRGWVVEFARNAMPAMWRYSKAFSGAQVFSEGQAVQIKTMCDHAMAVCELREVRAANPKKRAAVARSPAPPYSFPWLVETQVSGKWGTRSAFASKDSAVQYAQALADADDKTVRVRKAGT